MLHEIFLKSKLQIMQLKTLTSILEFKNYFLTYSALQTLAPPNLSAFMSFSNTKYFQCFVLQQPKEIKHFKSLSKIFTNRQCTEPGSWLNLVKLCSSRDKHCTTNIDKQRISTDKSSSFESRCYLMLEVHNTLITHPT